MTPDEAHAARCIDRSWHVFPRLAQLLSFRGAGREHYFVLCWMVRCARPPPWCACTCVLMPFQTADDAARSAWHIAFVSRVHVSAARVPQLFTAFSYDQTYASAFHGSDSNPNPTAIRFRKSIHDCNFGMRPAVAWTGIDSASTQLLFVHILTLPIKVLRYSSVSQQRFLGIHHESRKFQMDNGLHSLLSEHWSPLKKQVMLAEAHVHRCASDINQIIYPTSSAPELPRHKIRISYLNSAPTGRDINCK